MGAQEDLGFCASVEYQVSVGCAQICCPFQDNSRSCQNTSCRSTNGRMLSTVSDGVVVESSSRANPTLRREVSTLIPFTTTLQVETLRTREVPLCTTEHVA